MKKTIRLNENDIKNIVFNTVSRMLAERRHHRPTKLDISEYLPQDDVSMEEPPMDEEPIMSDMPQDQGDMNTEDPTMGGDAPTEEQPMDEIDNGGSGDSELDDILNQLDDSKKEAVKKYAQSMINDNDKDGVDDNAENANMQPQDDGNAPQDPMQQMQESFMKEMMLPNQFAQGNYERKRGNKNISKPRKSPWIY